MRQRNKVAKEYRTRKMANYECERLDRLDFFQHFLPKPKARLNRHQNPWRGGESLGGRSQRLGTLHEAPASPCITSNACDPIRLLMQNIPAVFRRDACREP